MLFTEECLLCCFQKHLFTIFLHCLNPSNWCKTSQTIAGHWNDLLRITALEHVSVALFLRCRALKTYTHLTPQDMCTCISNSSIIHCISKHSPSTNRSMLRHQQTAWNVWGHSKILSKPRQSEIWGSWCGVYCEVLFCEPPHTVTWQPSCAIFIHCLFIEQMSFVAPFSNSLFIQRKETIAAISWALWWLLMANWRQESKWIGLYVHKLLTMASPTLS